MVTGAMTFVTASGREDVESVKRNGGRVTPFLMCSSVFEHAVGEQC